METDELIDEISVFIDYLGLNNWLETLPVKNDEEREEVELAITDTFDGIIDNLLETLDDKMEDK